MKDDTIPLGMIEQIYECAAAADAGQWQDVYEQLATRLSSGTGSIQYIVRAENRIVPIATTNPTGLEEELSPYIATLPYRDAFLGLRSGELFERHRHLPDEEFKRAAVYQGLFKRAGKFHLLHHCLVSTPEFSGGISFTRPETAERFSEEEIAAYTRIGSHIQRALGLQISLQQAAGEKRLLREGWDRIEQAAFFVDAGSRVMYHNRAASKMMKQGGVKLSKTGEIKLGRVSETRRLHELISNSFVTGEGSVMSATRSGRAPIILSVSPFAEKFGPPELARPMALVTFSAPSRTNDRAAYDLLELFGLTAAESKVALMIAGGDSIKEIADKLSVSEQTARTHLKRIFSKTSTKRQAALVKLVLSLPNQHH